MLCYNGHTYENGEKEEGDAFSPRFELLFRPELNCDNEESGAEKRRKRSGKSATIPLFSHILLMCSSRVCFYTSSARGQNGENFPKQANLFRTRMRKNVFVLAQIYENVFISSTISTSYFG